MMELNAHQFDLIISDIARPAEQTKPLSACRVHWFFSPQTSTSLDEFNKRYNENPGAGFYLAERMMKEMTEAKRPPIIFYSTYNKEQLVTTCSNTIAVDTFTLINSIFDNLERRRWAEFERYSPPWAVKTAPPKP